MIPIRRDISVEDAAAWVLRVGVFTSVVVMFLGLLISLWHGRISVAQMQSLAFNDHLGTIASQALSGGGFALIEIGVLLLVLTPIMRVASSMVLFAVVERDWFYAAVTFFVLCLTLLALLILK
ncbi:MAG: DUF1634 domain-containing protein [Elusimicrobiota bacterium]